MEARERIGPAEFEALVERADLVVSHAGIGTILTTQRFATPIVLFPRRFDHGEHRNDHQVATARNLAGRAGALIALDETQLAERIAQGLAMREVAPQQSATALQLHHAVETFITRGTL
jgi:UDP-N-acetylglucosamine transferase subunit ALG13